MERALSELRLPHDVKEYADAGHGFLNRINAGPLLGSVVKLASLNYHHQSAEDAWARILGFL